MICFTSCNTLKQFIKNNKTCLFDDPIFEIRKQDLTFDGEKYDSILNFKGVLIAETYKYQYEVQPNMIGITNKNTKLTKWMNYSESKKIESIAFFIRNSIDTNIGKEYFFNTNGDIIKTINHEKCYTICWTEAISILKRIARKEIKKFKINTFSLNRVNINEFPNSRPRWIVSMKGEVEGDYVNKRYVIDGVTGELIRTYSVNKIYESIKE